MNGLLVKITYFSIVYNTYRIIILQKSISSLYVITKIPHMISRSIIFYDNIEDNYNLLLRNLDGEIKWELGW